MIRENEIYTHDKTGNFYIVRGVTNLHATKSGWDKQVVYESLNDGALWSRPISEFESRYTYEGWK